MDKLSHLFLLCGLLILTSLAVSSITSPTLTIIKLGRTRNSTKGNVIESKTLNASYDNSAQHAIGNITTSNDRVNSTSPEIRHSTNVTNSDAMHNSAVPSPATQTKSITVQLTQFATDKNTATQFASEPTATALSTASTILSSPVTTAHVRNEGTSSSTPAYLTTKMPLDNKTNNETRGHGLSHSEKSMAVLFSIVLGVIVLIVLGQFLYKVSRNKKRNVQYSHRRLYNDRAGAQTDVRDDTLVISGGLYDGPQIYNPTVTVLNDEDRPTFSYTSPQFYLEFLHDDHRADHEQEGTNSEPLNIAEQES